MELFKNTNFDFLGKKWPFIIASLVLTAAGVGSLIVRGGPNYGIDFKGGALLYLRFNQEPPVQKIRSALESKITGEVSVQQITGQPEVLVGTEIHDEKELNADRQTPTFEIDTFVVQGATLTQPQGINASGDISGDRKSVV